MRDHREEHEGCKAMWPWLKWCSRYRYASQLVGYALEDIKGVPEEVLDQKFQFYRTNNYWKRRSDTRAKYIQAHAGWEELEREAIEHMTDYMIEDFGPNPSYFEGRTREEEIEHRVFEHQQKLAIHVLYAYGMFNPRTGKIELDRLKKLP